MHCPINHTHFHFYQTETLLSMEFHLFQTQSFIIPHIYKQLSSNFARIQTLDHSAGGKSLHSLACKLITLTGKGILNILSIALVQHEFQWEQLHHLWQLLFPNWFTTFFSFNYVLWSDTSGWFNRLFTTQKKVIRIKASAQDGKLSGSLFKRFSTPPTWQWIHTIITVSEKNI